MGQCSNYAAKSNWVQLQQTMFQRQGPERPLVVTATARSRWAAGTRCGSSAPAARPGRWSAATRRCCATPPAPCMPASHRAPQLCTSPHEPINLVPHLPLKRDALAKHLPKHWMSDAKQARAPPGALRTSCMPVRRGIATAPRHRSGAPRPKNRKTPAVLRYLLQPSPATCTNRHAETPHQSQPSLGHPKCLYAPDCVAPRCQTLFYLIKYRGPHPLWKALTTWGTF